MLRRARTYAPAPLWWTGLAASIFILFGSFGPPLLTRSKITGPGPSHGTSQSIGIEAGGGEPFFPVVDGGFIQPLIIALTITVLIIVLIVALVALVFAVRFLLQMRRRRPVTSEVELTHQLTPAPKLRIDAVRAARDALAGLDGHTTDRVIAMWLQLERAAAAAGKPRRAAATPAAWAKARLIAAGAPADATTTLVETYYRARFRPETMLDERAIERADAALQAILEAVR